MDGMTCEEALNRRIGAGLGDWSFELLCWRWYDQYVPARHLALARRAQYPCDPCFSH